MAPEKSARRLGRGLDALFGSQAREPESLAADTPLREIEIARIASNPFQPRKSFKPEELRELQESIGKNGLLQPVTVRNAPDSDGFQLIAGERRLRAASGLGWKTIPAVVKEISDQGALTLALVENLQRSDLDPIEEAEGYDRLIRDFGHTQQTVAQMVGKDRSTVANVIRILQLPVQVREMISRGQLSSGQARPLLGLEREVTIISFARLAVDQGWSAREVERRVREAGTEKPKGRQGRPHKKDERPPEVRSLEQRLRKHLQTDVAIQLKGNDKGAVVISFYSPEDLERLIETMGLP
jgi:ParB family chromosome partitioning protein